jgi:uncharacterized membrane protein
VLTAAGPAALGPGPDPDPCSVNPTSPGCEVPGKPRIVAQSPGVAAAPRGRTVSVPVTLRNTGGSPVTGVKLCARVPAAWRKTVRVGCVSAGSIGPGQSRKVTLKARVAKKARRGTAKLRLLATWSGGGQSAAAKSLRIR